MASGGPDTITLRAIAREMGITANVIHGYFAPRDDLITTLVNDGYTAPADAVDATRHERIAPALRRAFASPSRSPPGCSSRGSAARTASPPA